MKRTIRIGTMLSLALIAIGSVAAQDMYVTSRIATVMSEPSATAGRVGIARQGDAVTVLGQSGEWYQIEAPTATGWLQGSFLGNEPAAGRVAESNLENISSVTTRRRASAYTTSAAATRGLSDDDNVRERQNLSFEAYNFRAIDWVKRFEYSDDELIEFAQAEGIGL